jgi:intracellular septation protein
MHAFLEYIPLVIFFVFYKFADIYWATASLIVASALQMGYFLIKKQPIPKRNLVFFGLIAIFGGLTIYMQDETFLKWKVTIIQGFFATALIVSQTVFNKNIIKEFLGEALTLPEDIWNKLNMAWAMFFAICGLLNWYIAFNFSLETWVNFKVFGLTILTFVFAIGSVMSLYKYMPNEPEEEKQE